MGTLVGTFCIAFAMAAPPAAINSMDRAMVSASFSSPARAFICASQRST